MRNTTDLNSGSVDPVKRKVISELFFAPSVVLPIVGGVSAGLLSFAVGGSTPLTLGALAGVLGGVGWMLTRMIFKVEDITEAAMQADLRKREQEENAALDLLQTQLESDGDSRTQDYLTLLRSLRSDFEKAVEVRGLQFRSARIREQIDQVFDAAVAQLKNSFRLWQIAQQLRSSAKHKVLNNREQVLQEIDATIDRLNACIVQFQQLHASHSPSDLHSMGHELEETIRIARRTEERMREIENPASTYDSHIQE